MVEQVHGDGRTVWVHGLDGSCLGRFSRFGIDVHRSVTEQVEGKPQCLDCTHEKPDLAGWRRFQDGVRQHYGVEVGDEHMPDFIRRQMPGWVEVTA